MARTVVVHPPSVDIFVATLQMVINRLKIAQVPFFFAFVEVVCAHASEGVIIFICTNAPQIRFVHRPPVNAMAAFAQVRGWVVEPHRAFLTFGLITAGFLAADNVQARKKLVEPPTTFATHLSCREVIISFVAISFCAIEVFTVQIKCGFSACVLTSNALPCIGIFTPCTMDLHEDCATGLL